MTEFIQWEAGKREHEHENSTRAYYNLNTQKAHELR